MMKSTGTYIIVWTHADNEVIDIMFDGKATKELAWNPEGKGSRFGAPKKRRLKYFLTMLADIPKNLFINSEGRAIPSGTLKLPTKEEVEELERMINYFNVRFARRRKKKAKKA